MLDSGIPAGGRNCQVGAEKAIAGKAVVKRNRFVQLSVCHA
jgi:hypothetical protein